MPTTEEALGNSPISCATEGSSTTEFAASPKELEDTNLSGKIGPTGGSLGACAPKTSKRFVDEDSRSPEYRSDTWRMANFKVVPCSKRYAHDWTICPFAHPGEKARRRDPRVHGYAGIACPEMKKAGFCSRGDKCPYAHNVFEFWLHPTRYRTQLCNDGTNCTRNVCFFAHTLEEMRAVPCKPVESRKEPVKGGAVSPDTPFLQSGNSALTSSSTSSDVWYMLSPEDRARSAGLSLAEELPIPKASRPSMQRNSTLIDELANSLANVKLAMASEKRDDVINMLSKLLQEAIEDKSGTAQSLPSRMQNGGLPHNHAAELSLALSALDHSQARSLLGDTDRRTLIATQLANSVPDARQDWQHIVQQILDGTVDGQRPNSTGPQNGNHNPLLTAPAALDHHRRSQDLGANLASRVLSADLSNAHQQSFWPSVGVHELQHHLPPDIPRAPSSHFGRCMSGDIDLNSQQLPALNMLDDSLFGGPQFQRAANPNALRRQAVNLDDMPSQKPQHPRREVRKPPISAFQSAASQDWKQPVGRLHASTDLRWTNSGGRLSSCDLATIKEGLPPLSYPSSDLYQCGQPDGSGKLPFAPMSHADRSKSTNIGSYEPTVLSVLPAPLSFPTTQPGGRDPSALHSAPYDLALAYATDRDYAARGRRSVDRQPQLQGWGGLQAQDYGQTRF